MNIHSLNNEFDLENEVQMLVETNYLSDSMENYVRENCETYQGVLYRGSGSFDGEMVVGNIVDVGYVSKTTSWSKSEDIAKQFIRNELTNDCYLESVDENFYEYENGVQVLYKVENPFYALDIEPLAIKYDMTDFITEKEVLLYDMKFEIVSIEDKVYGEIEYKEVLVKALDTHSIREKIMELTGRTVLNYPVFEHAYLNEEDKEISLGDQDLKKPLANKNSCVVYKGMENLVIIKGNEELYLNYLQERFN